ncbi:LOW QUALITY PROTEIN: hypothetical protein PHPALM_28969 [Phytophthora palmivora]|uniref:Uncharacterized protein n=1 Tax=Phytophthora palmivora TaxID=4796 RepID=A0A2P4X8S0_9STRA|nr:LOW QUALITY PROTEIN: hypothetical protein PHPALM_28969 [Phytophthora palmivora]
MCEVRALYEQETSLIKLKLAERGVRCVSCRSLAGAVTQNRVEKYMSFDILSLLAERSKVLGLLGSREDQSKGVYQQVYVVTNSIHRRQNPGLVEFPGCSEDSTNSIGILPEGQRVIGVVGGIGAVSTGFIDCVPVDMLIDSALLLVWVISAPETSWISWCFSLIPLAIRGVIDLPIRLGSQEIILPIAVVKRLHVDMILGTELFKAVLDLETDLVTIKAMGEGFPVGSPRVEEMYTIRMSSTTTRVRTGGQALVVPEVLGEVKEDSTVLVEGTLCTVHDQKAIAEVGNASTEDVVKAGALMATVTLVREMAFNYETTTTREGDASWDCASFVSCV